MKKNLKIIIIFFLLFNLFIRILIPEMNSSIFTWLFSYHNTGKIIFKLDGNIVQLDNIDIILNSGNSEAKGKIKDGKFKFWRVSHSNKCTFAIPAKLYNGEEDLVIEASFYNPNYWDINDFNINISIETIDRFGIHVDGFVKTKSDGDLYNFWIEKDENDSVIRIHTNAL